MKVLATAERPDIVVAGPEAPELEALWQLAQSKFRSREGRDPASRADVNTVTDAYHALTAKSHGSLGQIVREVCARAPGGD